MYIKNQWYLACLLDELKEKNPLEKRILNEFIVIFRTASGKIGVIENRCCHRNVYLSLGSVAGENIKCGYHGWEYGCEGTCQHIPSLPEGEKIPPSIKVKKYTFVVKHRSVWIWMGDAPADESLIPPMPEMDHMPMVYNYHTLKADLPLVAESLIDAYHINHVHKNSIKTFMGNLYDEKVDFHLNVTDNALTGYYLRNNDGSFFEQFYFGFNKQVETHFGFWFPNISKLDIRFKKRRMVIYEHFYQIDEENICMCQITLWENILDFLPPFARWFMLQKSIKIVREDLAFLENNQQQKKRKERADILLKADEVSIAFMQLWKRKTKKAEHETVVAKED